MGNRILVTGTWDTKSEEMEYLCQVITSQGGEVLRMDVSVLGECGTPVTIDRHQVAAAGGSSIREAVAAGDENIALQIMARGAARLAAEWHRAGRFDGVIVLGGSMGTDLALDLCAALPVGVPKYVVSTVSFSPMIPPERLAPDIQMILWAGGLYGLNSLCKSALSQAAGAVLGAARAVEPPRLDRPLIGMTALGKTTTRYMVQLKPALEARGFEVAIFHATGMGGRAFESLAESGAFAAVLDFVPQELGNHVFGSAISAGPDRLLGAGRRGIPQLVSIGCYDLVDLVGWQPLPERFRDSERHAHNRLITSVALNPDERREVAKAICARLALATSDVVLLLPNGGGNEWDRPGGVLENREGLAAFADQLRQSCPPNVRLVELDCHINDPAFDMAALEVVDGWIASGLLSAQARPHNAA